MGSRVAPKQLPQLRRPAREFVCARIRCDKADGTAGEQRREILAKDVKADARGGHGEVGPP